MQFQQILKVDSARKILDVLDPIVAVSGKDGSFILTFHERTVSCIVKDESSVMMCMMEADTTGLDYAPSCINPLEIPARPMMDALKSVGDVPTVVGVTASGQVVVDTATRRRTFNSLAAGNIPRSITFDPDVYLTISKGELMRFAGLEKIGDTVHFTVTEGNIRAITAGDSEVDEIIIPSPHLSDAKTAVGSTYLTDIVKCIRADDAEIGFSTNSLFRIRFAIECASFSVLIAPRVESD